MATAICIGAALPPAPATGAVPPPAAQLGPAPALVAGAAERHVQNTAEDGPVLRFGVVRDVIVDHPGQRDSTGRFIALAVRTRAPRTAQELTDLVVRGVSRPDPAAPAVGGERVLEVDDDTAEVGAGTALEVPLDAAWIAARRTAGHRPAAEHQGEAAP